MPSPMDVACSIESTLQIAPIPREARMFGTGNGQSQPWEFRFQAFKRIEQQLQPLIWCQGGEEQQLRSLGLFEQLRFVICADRNMHAIKPPCRKSLCIMTHGQAKYIR